MARFFRKWYILTSSLGRVLIQPTKEVVMALAHSRQEIDKTIEQ